MAVLRIMAWFALGLAILVGISTALLLTLDWRWLMGPELARIGTETLERSTRVDGPVRFGFWPGGVTVAAKDVALANTSWGSEPDMVRIGRAEARIRALPLLGRSIVVDGLTLTDTRVVVEIDYEGLSNRPRPGPLKMPDGLLAGFVVDGPRDIALHNFRAVYKAPDIGRPWEVVLATVGVRPTAKGLDLALEGRFTEAMVALKGTVLELHDLIDGGASPVKAALTTGETSLLIEGILGNPARKRAPGEMPRLAVRLDGKAPDLKDVGKLLGEETLRGKGPVLFSADVDATGDTITVTGLSAKLGEGTLVGSATLKATAAGFSTIEGVFASERFDGEVLLAPWRLLTAAPLDKKEPLPLTSLRRLKLDVAYTADGLTYRQASFADVNLHVRLADGLLAVAPFEVSGQDGALTLQLAANFKDDVPSAQLKAAVRDLDFAKLTTRAGQAAPVAGTFEGVIDLKAKGATPKDLIQSLTGRVGGSLRNGKLAPGYLDHVPEAWRDALRVVGDGTSDVPVSCALVRLSAANGVAGADTLYADAGNARISGEGLLSLSSDAVNVLFAPWAKKRIRGEPSAPILHMGGTLDEPLFDLKPAPPDGVPEPKIRACAGALAGLLPAWQSAAVEGP